MSGLQELALRLLLSNDNLSEIMRHTPNLTYLAVSSPLLSDAGFTELRCCPKLVVLSVSTSKSITDAIVSPLAACQLHELRITGTKHLSDSVISSVASSMTQLHTLQLSGARDDFATAAHLRTLVSCCTNLTSLDLCGQRRMTSEAMRELSQSAQLKALYLNCDFEEGHEERVADLLVSSFPSLSSWTWTWPHCYSSKILKAIGIEVKYGDGDIDLAPHQRLVSLVKAGRPHLKVKLPGGFMLRKAIEPLPSKRSIIAALVKAYAERSGLRHFTTGYEDDTFVEDEYELSTEEPRPDTSSAPVAPQVGSSTAGHLVCSRCQRSLTEDAFSKKQLKNKAQRRCKACIESGTTSAIPTSARQPSPDHSYEHSPELYQRFKAAVLRAGPETMVYPQGRRKEAFQLYLLKMAGEKIQRTFFDSIESDIARGHLKAEDRFY